MSNVIIDNIDFMNLTAEKYWSPTKNTNINELVDFAITTNGYFASLKVDGHWAMIIKDLDGKFYCRGRSKSVKGDYTDKADFIPHINNELDKLIPNGTVLLGELYLKDNEGSRNVTTIMGCKVEKALERQKKTPLTFYCFDMLAFNGKSIMNTPCETRVKTLIEVLSCKGNSYVESCEYIDSAEIKNYICKVRSQDREGVVLKLKGAPYEPGKRTTKKSIKVKKELENDVDCFITGNYMPATREYTGKQIVDWIYWEDRRTGEKLKDRLYREFCNGRSISPITKGHYYDWAGSIELGVLDSNGNVKPIAWISNLTEEVKSGVVKNNDEWLHKVVKINAMMREKDTGMFRHAKIMEWRDDIDYTDCTEDKLNDNTK